MLRKRTPGRAKKNNNCMITKHPLVAMSQVLTKEECRSMASRVHWYRREGKCNAFAAMKEESWVMELVSYTLEPAISVGS